MYEEDEVKVKDHDRTTRKYWGSTHPECNLNLRVSKKIPIVFLSLQNYDSYLIFQEAGKYNFKIYTKNDRKYMSFTIKQPKKKDIKQGFPLVFEENAHFLNNLLDNLVKI